MSTVLDKIVKNYTDEVIRRNKEVEAITLTDDEITRALWSAKITKWNEQQNAEYWQELEKKKP